MVLKSAISAEAVQVDYKGIAERPSLLLQETQAKTMPPSLPTLSTEIILVILSYLQGADIERLAQTLNRHLTPICLPFVVYRVACRRNAKRMRLLFGEEISYVQRWEENEPEIHEPLIHSMEFDGTLQWLIDAPEDRRSISVKAEQDHREISSKYLANLRPVLDGLGLQLPESFKRLVQDCRLQHKVVTLNDNYWRFPRKANGLPMIWKVPPELYAVTAYNQAAVKEEKKGEDVQRGYLYPFGWDQQCEYVYTSLYLDPGDEEHPPGHCVLRTYVSLESGEDTESDSKNQEASYNKKNKKVFLTSRECELGVTAMPGPIDRDLRLLSPSFEEFLLKTWQRNGKC